MLILAVSPDVAAHLARALMLYERRAADRGEVVPAELVTVAEAAIVASRRQAAPTWPVGVADGGPGADDAPVLLTTAAAGRLLSVSTRQVDRLLSDGTLSRVRLGGAVRVARSEIDELVASRVAAQRKVS